MKIYTLDIGPIWKSQGQYNGKGPWVWVLVEQKPDFTLIVEEVAIPVEPVVIPVEPVVIPVEPVVIPVQDDGPTPTPTPPSNWCTCSKSCLLL
jgi:hypothetical protein